MYKTFAIAVPKRASITMYMIDSIINGSEAKSENGKSEKQRIIIQADLIYLKAIYFNEDFAR